MYRCNYSLSGCLIVLGLMIGQSFPILAQTHQVGDIIRDESGIEMVYVPTGTFTLGIDANSLKSLCKQHGETEQCPEVIQEDSGATYLQSVDVKPFWLDRFEVSIEQFKKLCGLDANTDVDNCISEPRDKELALNPNQPQFYVSWYTADYICKLRYARLPTEAEWEYAASGLAKHVFAWGDSFNPKYVQSSDPEYPQTYPVGSIPENKSWVGAFDLTGNVAEWTDDRFAPRILSNINPANWPTSLPGNRIEIDRVAKGGSWNSPYWNYANFYRTNGSSDITGFRCARSLIPDI